MLVRWATEDERIRYGYGHRGAFDVLAAVHRMSGGILGIIDFSREDQHIGEIKVFDAAREPEVKAKLMLCAERQCFPKGHSFHYRFPMYDKESQQEHCPCCNNEPQPEGLMDIAELEFSYLTAERIAQGRLFGKCHVLCKSHYVHLYDMPEDILKGFMGDLQLAAKVLQEVTGAVKINYEIHGNTGPHLHCHLFPRYLDDDFPGMGIDVKLTEPSPYESDEEFEWFFKTMQEKIQEYR